MGSVAAFGMIQYVKRSIVYLPFGIGQLRIHDCVGLALVGAVWNDPIIEDCTGVFVGGIYIYLIYGGCDVKEAWLLRLHLTLLSLYICL